MADPNTPQAPTQDPYAGFNTTAPPPTDTPTGDNSASDPYAGFETSSPTAHQMPPNAMQSKKGGPVFDAEPPTSNAAAAKSYEAALDVGADSTPGGQMALGAVKGLYKTGLGLATLTSKAMNKLGIHSDEIDALAQNDVSPLSEAMNQTQGAGQKIGEMGETVGEFALGEEGLKAIPYLAKIPGIQKALQAYPKALPALLRVAQATGLGATQGGVKGAASGDAAAGAKEGAIGGAIGGTAGEVLGTVAPVLKKKIATGGLTHAEETTAPLAGKFQPALNNTPEEVLQYAQQKGIELTPGQALQTKARQAVQGAGERAFIGGADIEQAITANKEKLGNEINTLSDRLDPSRGGVDEQSAGTVLKNQAQAAKDASHAKAQAEFNKLPEDLKSASVDVSTIRDEWAAMMQDEQAVLRNAPEGTRSKLNEVLDIGNHLGTPRADGSIAPSLTFKDAQSLRSFFREMGDTYGAELPTRYQGLFKKLTHELNDAMEQTASNIQIPKPGGGFESGNAVWERANKAWKSYTTDFGSEGNSALYKILNADTPEQAARMVVSRKIPSDIDILAKNKVDLGAVKRQVINDIAKKGWRTNPQGLAGYSDAFLEKLFGADKKELYLQAELGRRLGYEVNPSGTSNVAAAHAQIPSSRGDAVKGVIGSTGMAKASMPRNPGDFLSTAQTPVSPVARSASAAAGVAAANSPNTTMVRVKDADGHEHLIPAHRLAEAKKDHPELDLVPEEE